MKKIIAIILIACVLFSTAVIVSAGPPPPPSPPSNALRTEIDDGEKVFILLRNNRPYRQFEKSGLYYNFEPYEAIYTFDFHTSSYDSRKSYHLSNDGMHFAYTPRLVYRVQTKTFTPVIVFYSKGELIRSYELSELPIDYNWFFDKARSIIDNIRFTTTTILFDDSDKTIFCTDTNIITVTTMNNDIINFGINTGKIISDEGKAFLERIILEEPEEEPEPFTTADALAVLSHVTGLSELSEADLARFDVNGDGVVDAADALIILRIAVGLEM
jgi:hypothetical protein